MPESLGRFASRPFLRILQPGSHFSVTKSRIGVTLARLASRDRLSFSKLREVKDLPNLIEVQTDSFRWFLEEGVAEVLRDISPIEDFTGQLKLELTDHVFDPPKHSEDECRGAT